MPCIGSIGTVTDTSYDHDSHEKSEDWVPGLSKDDGGSGDDDDVIKGGEGEEEWVSEQDGDHGEVNVVVSESEVVDNYVEPDDDDVSIDTIIDENGDKKNETVHIKVDNQNERVNVTYIDENGNLVEERKTGVVDVKPREKICPESLLEEELRKYKSSARQEDVHLGGARNDALDLKTSNEKFMVFLFAAGLNNALLALEVAMPIAAHLNRTLLIPYVNSQHVLKGPGSSSGTFRHFNMHVPIPEHRRGEKYEETMRFLSVGFKKFDMRKPEDADSVRKMAFKTYFQLSDVYKKGMKWKLKNSGHETRGDVRELKVAYMEDNPEFWGSKDFYCPPFEGFANAGKFWENPEFRYVHENEQFMCLGYSYSLTTTWKEGFSHRDGFNRFVKFSVPMLNTAAKVLESAGLRKGKYVAVHNRRGDWKGACKYFVKNEPHKWKECYPSYKDLGETFNHFVQQPKVLSVLLGKNRSEISSHVRRPFTAVTGRNKDGTEKVFEFVDSFPVYVATNEKNPDLLRALENIYKWQTSSTVMLPTTSRSCKASFPFSRAVLDMILLYDSGAFIGNNWSSFSRRVNYLRNDSKENRPNMAAGTSPKTPSNPPSSSTENHPNKATGTLPKIASNRSSSSSEYDDSLVCPEAMLEEHQRNHNPKDDLGDSPLGGLPTEDIENTDEKFMLFLFAAGLNNALIALEVAMPIAAKLNRTLLIPYVTSDHVRGRGPGTFGSAFQYKTLNAEIPRDRLKGNDTDMKFTYVAFQNYDMSKPRDAKTVHKISFKTYFKLSDFYKTRMKWKLKNSHHETSGDVRELKVAYVEDNPSFWAKQKFYCPPFKAFADEKKFWERKEFKYVHENEQFMCLGYSYSLTTLWGKGFDHHDPMHRMVQFSNPMVAAANKIYENSKYKLNNYVAIHDRRGDWKDACKNIFVKNKPKEWRVCFPSYRDLTEVFNTLVRRKDALSSLLGVPPGEVSAHVPKPFNATVVKGHDSAMPMTNQSDIIEFVDEFPVYVATNENDIKVRRALKKDFRWDTTDNLMHPEGSTRCPVKYPFARPVMDMLLLYNSGALIGNNWSSFSRRVTYLRREFRKKSPTTTTPPLK